jgi:hypothetical protein
MILGFDHVSHVFWYSIRGGGVLAMNLKAGGAAVLLRLEAEEARAIVDSLTHADCQPGYRGCKVRQACTRAWWCYDREPEGLLLYRDDHFSVTLPNGAGHELVAVLEAALRDWAPDRPLPFDYQPDHDEGRAEAIGVGGGEMAFMVYMGHKLPAEEVERTCEELRGKGLPSGLADAARALVASGGGAD